MKTNRNELEKVLKRYLSQIALSSGKAELVKTEVKNLCNNLKDRHNYPEDMTTDIIFRTPDLSVVSEPVLFFLCESLKEKDLTKYFTDLEINEYSKMVYETPKAIKFPFRIPCMPVSENQWVAAITTKLLIDLSRQQLIVYNTNTQRVLKRKVKGGEVSYQIELNKSAVEQISSLMKENSFIPNAITLNMGDDSEADYYYDDDRKELVIKSLKAFDIIDGYHRLVAITKNYNEDNGFIYPMILNIVDFSEDKAKSFIYQEDQKTKMSKVNSDSLNTSSDENYIVERLNESSGFNFQGMISPSGIISNADLGAIIKRMYFTGTTIAKSERKGYRLGIVKALKIGLNAISDEYPELLNHTFSTKELYVLTLAAGNYDEDEGVNSKIVDFEDINKLPFISLSSAKTLRVMKQYLGIEE